MIDTFFLIDTLGIYSIFFFQKMLMRSKIVCLFIFLIVLMHGTVVEGARSPFINQLLKESDNLKQAEDADLSDRQQPISKKKSFSKKRSFNKKGAVHHYPLVIVLRTLAKVISYCGGWVVWRKILPRVLQKPTVLGRVSGTECISFGCGLLVLLAAYEELLEERYFLNLPDQMKTFTALFARAGHAPTVSSPIPAHSLQKDEYTMHTSQARDLSSPTVDDTVPESIQYDVSGGFLCLPPVYKQPSNTDT